MALKAIIGVEHLPPNDPTWMSKLGYGITRGGTLGAGNQSTIENGWIKSMGTSGGQDLINIPLDRFLVAPATKVTLGVRMRFSRWADGGSLVSRLSGSTNGTLLVDSTIAPYYAPGGLVYFEVSYNKTTGMISRRLNDNPISEYNAGAGFTNLGVELWHRASTTNALDFRDIYITDDLGNEYTGFLGAVVASPIALAVTEAEEWTTSPADGSVSAAIYSPGSVPTDLVAVSPSSRKPLKAALSTPMPDGVEVFGIEFGMGGRSEVTGNVTIATKVSTSDGEVAGSNIVLPTNVYNYDKTTGVIPRAPGGGKWTKALINAATLTLTPQA